MKKQIAFALAAGLFPLLTLAQSAPDGETCQIFTRALAGKSYAAVRAQSEVLGLTVRIAKKDGEVRVMTMDYNPVRLNLEVEKDKVTAAHCG